MKTPEEFMEERGFHTHPNAMTEVDLVYALMRQYAEYYSKYLVTDEDLASVRLSLPDNEEIEKESECLIAKHQKINDTLGLGFRAGAKWMRDEIVNRNGSEA